MNFIKTTVIGGIVFLVPVIIVVAILGKAFELMLLRWSKYESCGAGSRIQEQVTPISSFSWPS